MAKLINTVNDAEYNEHNCPQIIGATVYESDCSLYRVHFVNIESGINKGLYEVDLCTLKNINDIAETDTTDMKWTITKSLKNCAESNDQATADALINNLKSEIKKAIMEFID